MKRKFHFILILGMLLFLGAPHFVVAQDFNLYSRIDDDWNSIAQQLTKRHLDDFSNFRDFWKQCRSSAPWLDTAPIDQGLLEDLSAGNVSSLLQLAKERHSSLSQTELTSLSSCLTEAYAELKNQAISQQKALEDTWSIGIFMDGDLSNSDFDIIDDINKINAIIFTEGLWYDWKNNISQKSLKDFLSGKEAPKLFAIERTKSPHNNQSSTSPNEEIFLHIEAWSPSSSNNADLHNNNGLLPWENICSINGNENKNSSHNHVGSVANMMDSDFSRDLYIALQWGKAHNQWNDYSTAISKTRNEKNKDQNPNNNQNKQEEEDYFSKLPCSDFFCITMGSNISKIKALKWGKSNAIETILDNHIKKMKPISWGSLSAQKMTQNSFQLPFLNVKFKTQVSGGAVFLHNSPQQTSTPKQTEKTIDEQFDTALKCALLEAWLNTDEKKNNGVIGGGFSLNTAHNTKNVNNSVIPLAPLESATWLDCSSSYQNSITEEAYRGFSTQVNEIYAFTRSMMDIIDQILDSEKKLDNVKQS